MVAGLLTIAGLGCGGAAATAPAPRRAVVTIPPAPQREVRAVGLESEMETRGITGSLDRYAVSQALDPRNEDFARCFYDRGRRVRGLGGSIRLQFRVDPTGRVLSVHPIDSTLGDRQLERCMMDVGSTTRFPRPNGNAEAQFAWSMNLDPSDGTSHPMTWDPGVVQAVVRQRRHELMNRCEPRGSGAIQVTAYVSPRGRVVAAGAAAADAEVDQDLDCIVDAVRRWRMPGPRRRAKVTFDVR